jgi:hypothetical protein
MLIAADTQERRKRGDSPRQDGFFDERGGLRSEAVELLEGILRQAAATFEEQKLPYLAHLYSTTAFEEQISPSTAMYLLRIAGELTFRQLLRLGLELAVEQEDEPPGIFGKGQPMKYGLLDTQKRWDQGLSAEERGLMDQGLLGIRMRDGRIVRPGSEGAVELHAHRRRSALTEIGRLLATAMRLDLIPEQVFDSYLRARASDR